jgi:rubredoxin
MNNDADVIGYGLFQLGLTSIEIEYVSTFDKTTNAIHVGGSHKVNEIWFSDLDSAIAVDIPERVDCPKCTAFMHQHESIDLENGQIETTFWCPNCGWEVYVTHPTTTAL